MSRESRVRTPSRSEYMGKHSMKYGKFKAAKLGTLKITKSDGSIVSYPMNREQRRKLRQS